MLADQVLAAAVVTVIWAPSRVCSAASDCGVDEQASESAPDGGRLWSSRNGQDECLAEFELDGSSATVPESARPWFTGTDGNGPALGDLIGTMTCRTISRVPVVRILCGGSHRPPPPGWPGAQALSRLRCGQHVSTAEIIDSVPLARCRGAGRRPAASQPGRATYGGPRRPSRRRDGYAAVRGAVRGRPDRPAGRAGAGRRDRPAARGRRRATMWEKGIPPDRGPSRIRTTVDCRLDDGQGGSIGPYGVRLDNTGRRDRLASQNRGPT